MPDDTRKDASQKTVLLRHEERAVVTKARHVTGRVTVQTLTEELEQNLPVALSGEAVEVTRIPIGRPIETIPDVVTEDGVTIIPVVEERVVITRQLYLREEVHIRRTTRQDTITLPVTTRRQTAHVTRNPAEAAVPPRDAPTPLSAKQRTDPMTYVDDTQAANGSTTISGLFDDRADAQQAMDRLMEAGIPAANVRLVEGADSADTAARGDGGKGFWESLGDFFFPDEDRHTYAEGLSRGGYLVTVTGLTSGDYEAALNILDDEGTVDLEAREESWRAEGWTGYESGGQDEPSPAAAAASAALTGVAARPAATDRPTRQVADHGDDYDAIPAGTATRTEDEAMTARSAMDARSDGPIEVMEERLRVGKRDTSHGRVRVRAFTVAEPVSESVDLREDRVEIERRVVDRPVTGDEALFQDRTVEAEEFREEAVVSKEARVVEEIELRKVSDTRRETVTDTVRHTEVEIEDDRDDAARDADLTRK